MTLQRKIIHIDMDAFFASVEQRDNVNYMRKPIIVGGQPDSRGVVAAASYEARKFGVHSAMSSSLAFRKCPTAIFVKPRIEIYRRISRVIMAILREYTDLVEPLSLDEAYLDVTTNKRRFRYARDIANDARARIYQYTGLTASAGVAPNKFLAKIASDINKPNGIKVIRPQEVESFLPFLPIRKLPGVGPKTEENMAKIGIYTVADLRAHPLEALVDHFGKNAQWYFDIARGNDERAVIPFRERKSIGSEDTFQKDVSDGGVIKDKLSQQVAHLMDSLMKKSLLVLTVTLKVKYGNFEINTRSKTIRMPTSDYATILSVVYSLLDVTDFTRRPIRLVGVSLSNLVSSIEKSNQDLSQQLELAL